MANIGCDICPCCGENKSVSDYICLGILNKGILSGIEKTWTKGLFHMKCVKSDVYICKTCGAEWESDPYEYM